MDVTSQAVLFLPAASLLDSYLLHSRRMYLPLLQPALFKLRNFRVSVVSGFLTRIDVGRLPLLLPLLYQLGSGLPAWQLGLLLMPSAAAAAAMVIKFFASRLLQRFGHQQVLVVNSVLIGIIIGLFSLVGNHSPLAFIVPLSRAKGFFNSLQFTSLNSMAYVEVESVGSTLASAIAGSMQQLSLSSGFAIGSLVVGWYLADLPQTDPAGVHNSLHHAFLTLGVITVISAWSFWTLQPRDGYNISQRNAAVAE